MMADTLSLISAISFIACIGFAALAAVLFFAFKIPDVAGELSGRKRRRSIQKQREANSDETEPLYERGTRAEETVPLNKTAGVAKETDSLEETVSLKSAVERMNRVTAGQSPSGAVALEMIEEVILVHSEEIVSD